MKKNSFILEKIPLETLIGLLTHAYEEGANFIDIIQIEGEDNTIKLLTKESYYRTEDIVENNSLNQEDINSLIE